MEISGEFWPVLLSTFGLFLLVGFLAQLIDGAVGMAYGVVSSSVLLAFGVPPAQVSATAHAAECFTTGASGASHLIHRNVDWKLFWRLAPAGVVGGVIGAYLLTGFDPTFIKAVVVAYLGVLGVFMLGRAIAGPKEEPPHLKHVIPLGIAGGFLDASGGGGWGPIVTSSLIGQGTTPRYAIGSVNLAEFFVTAAISGTFFLTIGLELWPIISGLILGGVIAAPFAAYATKHLPDKALMIIVGGVVILLSLRTLLSALHA